MQTIHPTTAPPQSPTPRRRRLIAASIAVTLSIALGIKLWSNHRVPPPDADPTRLSRYMATPAFAALPDPQKAPYLVAFRRATDRGQLTPEQQRSVITNINNRAGKNPLQQYFSLPSGKERDTFLDDIIDRVLKHEKLRPPPDKKGPNETRRDIGREADSIPPEDRARMNQFLQDLHDRRVARGLPDDGKFLFNLAH